MKRLLPPLCLLLCLLLGGCSAAGAYSYSRAHVSAQTERDETAINDRAELTDAIAVMVRAGVESDTLLISDYEGALDSDLEELTAGLTERDPYGVYAVSSLVFKQVSILSRTELAVSIQYSRTAREIAAVAEAPTAEDLALRITESLETFSAGGTFYLNNVSVSDPAGLVEKCWLQDPCAAVGLKSFAVASYPEAGDTRILDVTLEYLDTPAALRRMGQDVRRAAEAVCSEFSGETDREKADFVYAYLRDNVIYDTDAMRVVSETGGRQARTSLYTAYGALLEGRAAQSGIALAAGALCRQLGLETMVLSGTLDGEPYVWLVVLLDGALMHLDVTSRQTAEETPPAEGAPVPETPPEEAPDGAGEDYAYLLTLSEGRRRFSWDKRLYGVY